MMNLNRKGGNGKIGKPKGEEFFSFVKVGRPCLLAPVQTKGVAGRSGQGWEERRGEIDPEHRKFYSNHPAIIDVWPRCDGGEKKKDDDHIYKKSDEKSSFSLSHLK